MAVEAAVVALHQPHRKPVDLEAAVLVITTAQDRLELMGKGKLGQTVAGVVGIMRLAVAVALGLPQ